MYAIIAALCLTGYAPAGAQVDIESQREEGGAGFRGNADLDVNFRSGNVDLVAISPALFLGYGGEVHTVLLITSGDIGWQGGERYSNAGLAHGRYVRGISSSVMFEAFAQSNYDKARSLDFRYLAGAGIRLRVAGGDASGLWIGSSWMFEHEENDVAPEDPHPEHTSVNRWSNYASVGIRLTETATLEGTVYVQPDVARLDDLRVLLDTSLSVTVTSALSLETSVELRRDSDPVATVAPTDFRLATGFSLEW